MMKEHVTSWTLSSAGEEGFQIVLNFMDFVY